MFPGFGESSKEVPFFKSCFGHIKPTCFCAISIVYIICAGLVQLQIYSSIQSNISSDLWFVRLASILLCYALTYTPIWILRRLAQPLLRQWETETGNLASVCQRCLTVCFFQHLPYDRLLDPPPITPPPSPWRTPFVRASDALAVFAKQHRWLGLVGCTLGLNFAYVLWGVLQEKIMTSSYGGRRFREPQFLVFCNRVGALIMASVCIHLIGPRRLEAAVAAADGQGGAPLSCYANPALSNILSSWCQYEALLFITFPVQVLSKSCKTIPVMLMSKILYGRSYKAQEYITTALVSIGVSVFILSSPPEHSGRAAVNSVSGLVLICGYIVLDSYTSTFQDNLFRIYKISPLQMMRGVCTWAVLFTVTPLLADGTLTSSLRFAWDQPQFALDVVGSAVCSGFGQIMIFITIAEFGAVTFSIIMTIRQCLSILVSCLLFTHPINAVGALGLLITFGAVFFRIVCKGLTPTRQA
uniref:Adenosine 3'-phospho 5'-phosphosulfate transporter 1 n=1 Tax=Echinococcus granulosus TaxID=6210 RepID=A0A068WR36_ECHGR|nr:adenosine 3' phospho 5' phosphosulfate [Echinococcus granulosus]